MPDSDAEADLVEEEILGRARAALEEAEGVDHTRISIEERGEGVALVGAVSTPEESSLASLLAEHHAAEVVNELRVDPNLREGTTPPTDAEQAVPAENEVLIGSTDMLAGPDAGIETDMSRALEENVPWEPPDEPHLAPTEAEYGSALSEGSAAGVDQDDPDPATVGRADFAAADLTQEDLSLPPERVPSLDPEGVAPPPGAEPDPLGADSFGSSPPEDLEPYPLQIPDTPQGVGATGEGTAGGGGTSGVPATETGATGADTAAADPVRSTGGTMTDSGTERGPQAREDEPLREDFAQRDQETR